MIALICKYVKRLDEIKDLIGNGKFIYHEETISDMLSSKPGFAVSYINPFNLNSIDLEKVSQSKNWYLVFDGRFSTWAIRYLFGFEVKVLNFDVSGIAPIVFREVKNLNLDVLSIGGSVNDARAFREYISTKFQINYPISINGYVKDPYTHVLKYLTEKTVLLISTGSPRQDTLVELLLDGKANNVATFTCGAFITQTAKNNGAYYPDWFVKHNVRFLYRAFREPKVISRVLRYYVPFFCAVMIYKGQNKWMRTFD